MSAEARWLGIDFSGDRRKWSIGCKKSNVHIAEVRRTGKRLRLHSLRTPQELEGLGHPFRRLVNLLRKRDFTAAAIDAPFSIPLEYLPGQSHQRLLQRIGKIRLPDGKVFPAAGDFVACVLADHNLHTQKPLRCTEKFWRNQGVNVRSTLWDGPRGGAAMTSACLTLLREAKCPIWPWQRTPPGLLVEAFPAAQLCHWRLPYQRYNGDSSEACANRGRIQTWLEERAHLQLGGFRKNLRVGGRA